MRRLAPVALLFASRVAAADDTVDQLAAKVDDVAKEVAKVRGLPLKHAIPHDIVDRAQLHDRLQKLAKEDRAKGQAAAEGLALQRWGLIPLGTDLEALVLGVLDDQIAGYYDPKSKAMTFVAGASKTDPSWGEMVLAHELCHALQDQSFDLQKYQDLPDSEGDASTARHAVVEGDGIALMIEVVVTRMGNVMAWSNPTIAEMIQKEMGAPGNGDTFDAAPLVLREDMLFPYRAGFGFVAALRRTAPWSAVDGAFKRPPRSTEQIMHPERYLADEVPIAVDITPAATAALPGYAVVHSTVWGELGFDSFLRTHGVTAPIAQAAADGWGGDRVIALARPGTTRATRAIGLARSQWDTDADAIEASEALAHALDALVVGGSVVHSDTRTSWLALDGTVAWIERRGPSVVFGIGVPAWAAAAVEAAMWTGSTATPGNK